MLNPSFFLVMLKGIGGRLVKLALVIISTVDSEHVRFVADSVVVIGMFHCGVGKVFFQSAAGRWTSQLTHMLSDQWCAFK